MVMFVFGLSFETQFGCVHLRIVYLQNSWASLESGHVFEDYEDRTNKEIFEDDPSAVPQRVHS